MDLNIRVTTHPNGYTLSLEKPGIRKEFMYFNVYELIVGMIYHLVCGFNDYKEVEIMGDIVSNADNLAKHYATQMESQRKKMQSQIDKLKEKLEKSE